MTDLARILALWRELDSAAADYVLATVVAVEGPSYRKPGALMLLTADGRRVGTISGGCLEAQVASRAWWLTANGPTVQNYSTAEDDGDRPYGSGCGGIVTLLLERSTTAKPILQALAEAFERRVPLSIATVIEGTRLGERAFAGPALSVGRHSATTAENRIDSLQALADRSFSTCHSLAGIVDESGLHHRAWTDYRTARPALWIFGAGDDAVPLLLLARELGWFVSVADGRSHLATRDRFPTADSLSVLPIADLPGAAMDRLLPPFDGIQPQDAAIVMTHSFEQDAKILASLLAREVRPAYVGVLGPQRRTRELLGEAASLLQFPAAATASTADQWLAELHAPTGLDLGGDSPETIALCILAEIQKVRTAASGLPLRTVRSAAITLAV